MNKKILLLPILLLFFMASCSQEEEKVTKTEKKDFYIETKSFWDFSNEAMLEKTWILSSSQDITLNSNANWRVSNIFVKPWDDVVEGQLLASLEDSVSNYNLSVSSAKNALSSAENWLEVAKNNYEKLQINYDTTKLNLDKQIEDLKRNLKNLKIENADSSSAIELEKIENSISKLEIEYDNLLMSNKETLNTFQKNIEKEYIVLRDFLYDITYFSDEILGVTPKNRNKNDSFETYLWAKDSWQKVKTENLLKNLVEQKDYIDDIELSFNNSEDYQFYLDELDQSYDMIIEFLRNFDLTLSNSVENSRTLTKAQIDWYKSKVWGFRASYNWYKSQLIWLENNISNFLDSYKNTEQSLLKNIENLEKDKKIYTKWLDLEIENMQATLDEAIESRDLTLKNLEIWMKNAKTSIRDAEIRIEDARIWYSKAIKQAEKLNIKSPISWIVSDIMIDKWQEINSWTPSFKLLNQSNNEINISFTKDELDYIYEGKEVYYDSWSETFTGSIYSISKNADENLKYVAKVKLPNEVNYIWNILDLNIPINLDNKLIPLEALKINNSWVWTINFYSSWSINQKDIKVGDIYWTEVEVLGELSNDTELILNYVDNYDEEEFILKVK